MQVGTKVFCSASTTSSCTRSRSESLGGSSLGIRGCGARLWCAFVVHDIGCLGKSFIVT